MATSGAGPAASRAAGWRKGRGALGFLAPVLGSWRAEGRGEAGGYVVDRRLERVMGGSYVRMDVSWRLGDRSYEELAMFGRDGEGRVRFWSFTSDGRQSTGWLADASDLPDGAFAFEADMPAGRARMLFAPPPAGDGYVFAVESRTRRGWRRFVEHRYLPA